MLGAGSAGRARVAPVPLTRLWPCCPYASDGFKVRARRRLWQYSRLVSQAGYARIGPDRFSFPDDVVRQSTLIHSAFTVSRRRARAVHTLGV